MEIYTILHRKIALFAYVTAHVEIVCNWLDWDYHLKWFYSEEENPCPN